MTSDKQASSVGDEITEVHDTPKTQMSSSARQLLDGGAPAFRWASLWEAPVINHLNGKSYTLPIFNLRCQQTINFHLSWMGFFVAFLSWFAFPPLLPEAIKVDLKLTTAQIGNSNVIALLATLLVRFAMGPLVDRYGPRKMMALMLVVGAIPSGMAGLIHNASGLYAVRFFIGILGGTFVPCQSWTTSFFDKNIVGTANALVGGWGNLGGGVTFVVMVSLFQTLVNDHLSAHNAWRAAYAIVPVPILFFVAIITLVFGTDCPAGKWSQRHTLPASAIAARQGHLMQLDADERKVVESKMAEKEQGTAIVAEASDDEEDENLAIDLDIAVAEHLTWKSFGKLMSTAYTWLPALMYMTTFGFELAVDANLANVLFASHSKTKGFGQVNAGYYASTFGFLNFVTRPMGGFLADRIYIRYGVKGKKYFSVILGFIMGAMALGMGLYQRGVYIEKKLPILNVQMGFVVLVSLQPDSRIRIVVDWFVSVQMAVFCEMANGSIFALVPHCNAFNNGFMSGLVGGFGNIGGIIFALICEFLQPASVAQGLISDISCCLKVRFHPLQSYSQAWWISGIFAMGVNALCFFIPAPPQ
ncbi:MFS transporter, NNP family, nitrate/nitrite transporter, partial [Phenoliferia sp. Uapishka_3]